MLTEHESEVLGIMFGDGCLSRTHSSVQIAITGNKTDDKEYFLFHVKPLFNRVFGLELTVRYRPCENTMDLYRYSIAVASTLSSWGMPYGAKPESLRPVVDIVPRTFIRGLFDTDGCVYRKYGTYAQIQFKMSSKTLLEIIKGYLADLDLCPTAVRADETKYRFYLCRQADVQSFFRLVAPRNPRHLERLTRIHPLG